MKQIQGLKNLKSETISEDIVGRQAILFLNRVKEIKTDNESNALHNVSEIQEIKSLLADGGYSKKSQSRI